MKRKLRLRILFLSLIPASIALSSVAHAQAVMRVASDDMQRAALRLRDLGYYLGSIDGTNNEAMRNALHAFCDANGILWQTEPPDALYARSAIPAGSDGQRGNAQPSQSIVVTGKPVAWSDVTKLLTVGETYTVVSCFSGQTYRMRYIGGVGHAHMTPLSDEDANALLLLFSELHDFSKQPVTVALDGISVAASLQVMQHSDDAGDADTVYSLYFTDSVSEIGGLPDEDHAATVRIAAGA